MNLSHYISRRLRLRGSGTGSGVGVLIAVAGVAIAVMVMEFTLAIVVGFKDGIRNKLTGFDAQITVGAPYDAAAGLQERYYRSDSTVEGIVRAHFPEADLRLSLRQPGLLKTDDNFQGVVFLGQSPGSDFDFERANIVEGRWPDFAADSADNLIVLSRPIARMLNLGVGDKVFSTFIFDETVKLRRHTVAALYESNFGEYDNTVVYASLRGLQRVAGIDSLTANRLDIRGLDTDDIAAEAAALQTELIQAVALGELPHHYPVDNIEHTGAMYFTWLALLDTNVVVIFLLMLAVAGLTLVSSLFILILERVPMIGVLRAMGAPKSTVRGIFVDLAMRLVGVGMLIGNVLGIGLLLIQKFTDAIPLDPAMYYLSSVPVEIRPWAFLTLNVGVAVAAWLILVLPARLASGIDPAKAMDYD